ncbi:hypothetical protein CDL15_Pgr009181 [Punica granatum]|uniref:Uncharacterized protein n=1 Tax=Punica granatum TaxID=22663 RepID=A0A218WVJ1_PUNGR|nr:hypothetical protein CDL15_Pgr009181 [Punica granatum]
MELLEASGVCRSVSTSRMEVTGGEWSLLLHLYQSLYQARSIALAQSSGDRLDDDSLVLGVVFSSLSKSNFQRVYQ